MRGSAGVLVLVAALAASGCGAEGPSDQTAGASAAATDPASASASASTEPPVELVEVEPGRSLAMTCSGQGEPTVLYLHGLIQIQDSASWAHAPELRTRLEGETRYCEYERTNVGSSSDADGPIPVSQSVADLDAIVDASGAEGPVVLIGGSFGGLVAYTYAGTYPERVAGAVLLDPTLPDEPELDAMLPEPMRLTPDAWQETTEKIDTFGAYEVAGSTLANIPEVPGTVFVTDYLWVPDEEAEEEAEAFRAEVRAQQDELAARFSPGRTVTVDAPHAMIPVVPDEIAAAVLEVVAQAR